MLKGQFGDERRKRRTDPELPMQSQHLKDTGWRSTVRNVSCGNCRHFGSPRAPNRAAGFLHLGHTRSRGLGLKTEEPPRFIRRHGKASANPYDPDLAALNGTVKVTETAVRCSRQRPNLDRSVLGQVLLQLRVHNRLLSYHTQNRASKILECAWMRPGSRGLRKF